ncbi:DUF2407 C-terminal domain-containing protein [Podospora fimiseda]|uniref:DUF2407 C-terminal domain-containing protein n=1 Tax=Podospora fimiseda TaxID=252190 RepID=A0AAN7BSX9_9PEZI|nr:DUF2407 C-terminal domain-containing protein [Podospora fimiseda]
MSESSSRSVRASRSFESRSSQEQRQPLLQSQSTPTTPQQPYRIIVKFYPQGSDIEIDIPSPQTTTAVALKHLIRTRLASDAQSPFTPKLRLIHGGRDIPDTSLLSTVLKPPPPSNSLDDPKGKTPLGHSHSRILLHCSIGAPLSSSELDEEKRLANTIPSQPSTKTTPPTRQQQHNARHNEPRGFDRLAPGMSREDIINLRRMFLNHHASRYTPDNMPSPDRMLDLEDAWLDDPSNPAFSPSDNNQTGGTENDVEADGWAGNIDNLVIGTSIGFIFPLAAFAWLLRENSIWSKRMQVFVTLGAILSVVIGMSMELTRSSPRAAD